MLRRTPVSSAALSTAEVAAPMKTYRRNSAGGQALQRWQKTGKLTTIHVVYELERPITVEELKDAVERKLLSRFPRFRGYVSEDESRWEVPETVDPADYVVPVELAAETQKDEAAALRQHVQQQMAMPLPPTRSWNVHLITYSGSPARCAVLWRISHTVADGVVLAQIMSRVICEELAPDGSVKQPAAPSPTELGKATPTQASVADAAATVSDNEPAVAPDVTVLRRRIPPAGLLERVYCFVCGVFFVLALPFLPADTHTALQLGPHRFGKRLAKARRRRPSAEEGDGAAAAAALEASRGGLMHADSKDSVRLALGEPIAVEELRDAAHRMGVTINDLLMTAMAAALRRYLELKSALPPNADALSLTAVAVINPRPTMPQDTSSDQLLHDYAAMRGPGCDITLLVLPLPCGEMGPAARRGRLAATTRRLKLSPEAHLLRLGANAIMALCGLNCLIALYTSILAKFTCYVSNVVAPPLKGAFCGVPIASIWFGTTPLDFGVSFSFLSYAGHNRVCCVADRETVPDPELMAELVNRYVVEQLASCRAASGLPREEKGSGST